MTNHPRRQRDDDDMPAGGPPAGPLPPAAGPEPPVHTPNGHGQAFPFGAAALIGQAVAAAVEKTLPQILFSAFTQALSSVPVQAVTQQHHCAECLKRRIGWENAHRAEMEDAMTAAAVAAGVEPRSPQAGQVDFGPFLPAHLRPGQRSGIPDVRQAATTFQGTEVCVMHIPGVQAGRSPLLVATATMSPAYFPSPAP